MCFILLLKGPFSSTFKLYLFSVKKVNYFSLLYNSNIMIFNHKTFLVNSAVLINSTSSVNNSATDFFFFFFFWKPNKLIYFDLLPKYIMFPDVDLGSCLSLPLK